MSCGSRCDDLARLSRVPWNFGGGPVSIRLRSPGHCALQVRRFRVRVQRGLLGRCRWPLTRRNCLPASTMPAAHQRSAICPSRQRLTLLACSRQTEIIDSMALGERSVRASVGATPNRSDVDVCAPSHFCTDAVDQARVS